MAIENVWNNFYVSPLEAARYVDEFNSQAVGRHFDVVKIGWSTPWIRILGKRIQQLHIKEFSRKKPMKAATVKAFKSICSKVTATGPPR